MCSPLITSINARSPPDLVLIAPPPPPPPSSFSLTPEEKALVEERKKQVESQRRYFYIVLIFPVIVMIPPAAILWNNSTAVSGKLGRENSAVCVREIERMSSAFPFSVLQAVSHYPVTKMCRALPISNYVYRCAILSHNLLEQA